MRRDHFDVEVVHLAEVARLGGGRAGHSAHRGIQRHQVLDGDRPKHAALDLARHAFLPFERGLQAAGPAPFADDAALEFVDREHFAGMHHVVDIAMQQRVGVKRLVDRRHHRRGVDGVEIAAELALDRGEPRRRQRHVAAALVDRSIPRPQAPHGAIGARGQVAGLGSTARDHQWNSRLVDQRGVRLVEHRDREWTQDLLLRVQRQLIAQVVEANFVGGAVGNVAGIGCAPLRAGHVLLDHADRQAEAVVDAAHPAGIAARQVVVRGQHVNTLTLTREPRNRRHRRDRLSLAGLHLNDLPVGKRQRRVELNVEHAETKNPRCQQRRDRDHLRQRHRVFRRLPQLRIIERRIFALGAPHVCDRIRSRHRFLRDGFPPCYAWTPPP